MVVLVHYGGGASFSNLFIRAIGLTLKTGWSGVTLFFVLSGFLITGILWDAREAPHWWRNFYIRRSLRIFPLYYAALLLVVAAAAYKGTLQLCLTHIWVFFLYLQNFPSLRHLAETVASPLPMGHFWSLAVEEQFYLIWPFLITRMKSLRQAEYLCLSLFVLSAIFRLVIWTWHPDPFSYNQSLPTHAGELALGGYLAMRYRGNGWKTIESWTPLAMVLSLEAFLPSALSPTTSPASRPSACTSGCPASLSFLPACWCSPWEMESCIASPPQAGCAGWVESVTASISFTSCCCRSITAFRRSSRLMPVAILRC